MAFFVFENTGETRERPVLRFFKGLISSLEFPAAGSGMDSLLAASWIAPMTGPPLRDSAIVFRNGRIVDLGPIAAMKSAYPAAAVHEAGNAVVLPGLINAHTHLELSSLKPGTPPARFVDWIIELMQRASPADAAESVRIGIAQCLRFGVTAVGDITSQPAITRPLLAASPLGGVSFGEVRGMAQRRSLLEPRLAAATEPIASENIAPGISPHATYSVEISGYEKCLTAATQKQLPMATHLAETAEESEFLRDQTGPFRELWNLLGAWDENVPRFDGGPIRLAKHIGLLDHPTLLAHVNYCDDDELALLAAGSASVVYCPRTHAFFAHPPHRWTEMQQQGINVAVGTDSCASSPDLNLVDDLRLLHRLRPDVAPMEIWKLATLNAARAIQLDDIGSLKTGKRADLAVFAVTTDDPLREILEKDQLPLRVYLGGQPTSKPD